MTPYSLLRQVCGLSQREASELRGVRIDTVKSWDTGRNPAPDQALEQLRNLYFKITEAAENQVKTIKEMAERYEAQLNGSISSIDIGYPADDHEAQTLGLPCVGAWRAMAAIVIAELDIPVTLVPRGSTAATAAAMDAHGQ